MFKWIFSKDDKDRRIQELYDNNSKIIYSFVLTRTGGDVAAAEDITQETFVSAWKALDNFKHKSSYNTWLCGIAKNKLYEYYRKQNSLCYKELKGEDVFDELSSDINMDEIIIKNETRSIVIEALKKISPLYKNCLILKYIDNCSLKEISIILNKTPKAVDGIIQRGKKQFVREFDKIMQEETSHE